MILRVGFLISVMVGHYVIGWQMTMILFALGMGFLFDEHHISIAFFAGVALHSIGVLINYIFYYNETTQTLMFIGRISEGMPTVFIPIFTILLPSMLYGLAGYFSSNLFHIYQTISNDQN